MCIRDRQQAQDDPNIIMTDYVVGDPLKELYSNCGLFVFCLLYTSCLGFALPI